MKRALFFVYLDTHFVELSRLALLLKDAGGWECVIQFVYRYPARSRDLEMCERWGFRSVDGAGDSIEPSSEQVPKPTPPPPGPPRRPRFQEIVSAFQALAFPGVGVSLATYEGYLEQAQAVMAKLRPDVLILPEDNVDYPTGALIRAAKEQRVPSLIVPYTIANAEEIAEAYWDNPDYSLSRWRNRLASWLYPRWIHEHKGRKLLPLPPGQILAIESLGLAPPLPWVINSGSADCIAVENPFMLRYYLAAGLPRERMVVTGALADDVLFRRIDLTAGGSRQSGASTRRPVLLCALPPDQYRSRRRTAEFESYEALVRAWATDLAGVPGFDVVVRLHPRTLNGDVPYLESEYGLRVSTDDTAALVAGCDVFLASVSATIRMAIAAGKPVINYDCYRYRYSDFVDVPGVITVEHRDAFRAALARLADGRSREDVAARQREFAAREFPLDGHSGTRLLALIEALVARGRAGRPDADPV